MEEAGPIVAPPISESDVRRRCAVCQARLRLSAVSCRCELPLCARHLPSDAHACTYDYRAAQRRLLLERNPPIVPSKLAS